MTETLKKRRAELDKEILSVREEIELAQRRLLKAIRESEKIDYQIAFNKLSDRCKSEDCNWCSNCYHVRLRGQELGYY